MTGNMQEDPRLVAVEEEKQAALEKTDEIYSQELEKLQEGYDALGEKLDRSFAEQSQAQEKNTEREVADIQKQKEQAQKAYDEEQSAAYVDYQKQVDPYGAQAEKLAANGFSGSGYSESARVNMYNTYQNRVAKAREDLTQAMREFDAAVRDAWQQNSTALAKIAYDTLKTRTELSMKGVRELSQLRLAWEDRKWKQEDQYRDWEQEIRKQIQKEQEAALGDGQ